MFSNVHCNNNTGSNHAIEIESPFYITSAYKNKSTRLIHNNMI